MLTLILGEGGHFVDCWIGNRQGMNFGRYLLVLAFSGATLSLGEK